MEKVIHILSRHIEFFHTLLLDFFRRKRNIHNIIQCKVGLCTVSFFMVYHITENLVIIYNYLFFFFRIYTYREISTYHILQMNVYFQ